MLISDSLQPSTDQTPDTSRHGSVTTGVSPSLRSCQDAGRLGVGVGEGVLLLLFSRLQTPTPLQIFITVTALEDPKLTHPRAL